MSETSIVVNKNEAAGRFEVQLGESMAMLEYRESEGRLVLPHTEVPPAFEGRGIAGALARAALDDARTRHLVVVPLCSYVRSYIRGHPEYQDLVDSAYGISH